MLSFSDSDLESLRNEILEIDGINLVSYSFYSKIKREGSELNLVAINFETGIDLFDFNTHCFCCYNNFIICIFTYT